MQGEPIMPVGLLLHWKPSSSWAVILAVILLGICCAEIAVRLKRGESLGDILRLTGGTIKRTATATARTPMISFVMLGIGF